MSIETTERPALDLDTLQASWKADNYRSSYQHVQHILLYALIKTNMLETPTPNFNAIGLKVLTRLKKAFPPIIRPSKLSNGRYPYDTLESLLSRLSYTTNRLPTLPIIGITLSEQAVRNLGALAKWCADELRMERKS